VALNNLNWNKFREAAHSLKGSSGYVGAGQLQYDCFYIQDFHYKGQIEQMRCRYRRLIENVVEFISYSKAYLEAEK
jgi:HPt (histidine-containing phosphotransfer) domain-containing protein